MSIIYDVIQCSGFDGDCDNHANGKIRREAHRPMEHIGGFMRTCSRAVSARWTLWSSPSWLFETQNKTQLLASIYCTFYLAKVVTFETRNRPSTHVIDPTSFVKTCQQEKKEGSHQLHFSNKHRQGTKFENLLRSYEAQKKVVADMRP